MRRTATSMAAKYVLDAHALIWHLEGNPRLGARAKTVIDDADSDLVLPIIALAEAVFVVERGRTGIPDVETLLDRVDRDHRIVVHPLDRSVVDKTLYLGEIPEMHDRQIAATALLLADQGHTVFPVTKDSDLLASDAVPTLW